MKTSNHKSPLMKGLLFLLIIATILVSCKKDDNSTPRIYLVDYQLVSKVTPAQILQLVSPYTELYNKVSGLTLSNVNVYKITYNTIDVSGNKIIASGAVIVPDINDALPVVSYQHGTLNSQAEAPSAYLTGMETRGTATVFAAAGYAVSVPDYLGFGVSSAYPHPYEHAKTLGSASYDMLMAAKEFFKEKNITTTDKLFLAGYSEGGGATMALHKYIEENSDLVVTMSAPASGAYNKTAFAKEIVQRNEDLTFLPNFMWVIDSYNWVYGLNRSWASYVNEPYATTLEAVISPLNYNQANITHNPQLLFTTETRDGIINGTDTQFLAALADNDIFDWTPQYPVTLYYGTADDYVFPLNSETAYNAMLENGASITKVVYEGADHNTAAIPYMMDVFDLFESLK